jgi:hypothetical protein
MNLAYKAGWIAFKNGIKESQNPYTKGSDFWESWEYGWAAAKESL